MPTVADAWGVIAKIFTGVSGMMQEVQYKPVMALIFLMLIGSEFSAEFLGGKFNLFTNKYTVVRWFAYIFTFALIILYGVLDASSFIYVSF